MDHTVADPLPEVIALRRLIKDHRDDTVAGGAELLVNRNVGEAPGASGLMVADSLPVRVTWYRGPVYFEKRARTVLRRG